jgi:hypothetical protein
MYARPYAVIMRVCYPPTDGTRVAGSYSGIGRPGPNATARPKKGRDGSDPGTARLALKVIQGTEARNYFAASCSRVS